MVDHRVHRHPILAIGDRTPCGINWADRTMVAREGETIAYGAGAFQTIANRDLVCSAEHLFIVGGGNVGLIAGYYPLQAGTRVVGLCEALPDCSDYRVHRDKLARHGVPIYTSHTTVGANGTDQVESVTIVQIDKGWRPVAGVEETYGVRATTPREGEQAPTT